jgi:hypothetical protein
VGALAARRVPPARGGAGSRPVWLMTANPAGGLTLLPRNNPGWSLVVSNPCAHGDEHLGRIRVAAPQRRFDRRMSALSWRFEQSQAAEITAKVVAERLVAQLERSGFVIMQSQSPSGPLIPWAARDIGR